MFALRAAATRDGSIPAVLTQMEDGMVIGRGVCGLVDPKLSRKHSVLRCWGGADDGSQVRWEIAPLGTHKLRVVRSGEQLQHPAHGGTGGGAVLQPGDRITLSAKLAPGRELEVCVVSRQALADDQRRRRDVTGDGRLHTLPEFFRE